MEKNVIKKQRVHCMTMEGGWKLNIIKEISLIKKEDLETVFDMENLEDILKFVCTD